MCKCLFPLALLSLLQKTSFSILGSGGAGNVQQEEQWLGMVELWAQVWLQYRRLSLLCLWVELLLHLSWGSCVFGKPLYKPVFRITHQN